MALSLCERGPEGPPGRKRLRSMIEVRGDSYSAAEAREELRKGLWEAKRARERAGVSDTDYDNSRTTEEAHYRGALKSS